MAPAKTDGNRFGTLSEGELHTPSTSAIEVPIADFLRPPTKRQQRRLADNKKIRIVQSLKCGDECHGHEQEAFPKLGALKWGGKTAEFQPPLEGKESEESTAATNPGIFCTSSFR